MVKPTTREKILAIMDDNITVQRHTRDNIDFIVPNKVYFRGNFTTYKNARVFT